MNDTKIKIVVTAKMISGNFEPKFYPLIRMEEIESIHILRKSLGPELNKLHFHTLPKIVNFKIANIFITPIKLILLIKKIKPDFILSYHIIPHAFFAYFANKIMGIPFVVCQTGGLIQIQCDKNRLLKHLILHILKKAAFINVPGEFSKNYWVKSGVNAEKINILHSVIDTAKFYNKKESKIYDFIYVGGLIRRKRVDKIIRSFAVLYKQYSKCDNLKLLIVGKGNEEHNLKNLCQELNLNEHVIFYGFSDKVEELLNKVKIFIMSSEIEGLPVALMEAMACELTVIAPDIYNIQQAIQNNYNGFLVTDNLDVSLTEKMKFAYLNYESNKMLRENARKTIIEEHSVESAVVKWEKIITKLKKSNRYSHF